MAEEKKSVSFVYERKKYAQTLPCTGAYGGPTPDNSGVVVHLYVEYPSVPHSTDVEIESDGKFNASKGRDIKRGDFTREIQATLFMNGKSAIRIGEWLIEKGNMLVKPENPE